MAIGIIGTGNMGTILTTSLIEGSAARPSQFFITNRTREKAEKLKQSYPDIHIEHSAEDVIRQADIIFVCIKPHDIYPLLDRLKDLLTPQHLLVSITSPIRVDQIESVVHCSVARVIPSITNHVLSGSILITFGKSCDIEQQNQLLNIVKKIGTPIFIEEDITRVASDISSCGPAFFSYLIQRFIEAAVTETGINKEEATALTTKMIVGLGQLYEKRIFTIEGLQKKVNVKGGVTGMGLDVLEAELGDIFHHLFKVTHKKFADDHVLIDQQFDI